MLNRSIAFTASCAVLGALAQAPNLEGIPPYKKEYEVVGGLRVAGSEHEKP